MTSPAAGITDFENRRVLVPIDLFETLVNAASRPYICAFGGSQAAVDATLDAATAGRHIIERYADGSDKGPMWRVGQALMSLRRDRLLVQADADLIYERIAAKMRE